MLNLGNTAYATTDPVNIAPRHANKQNVSEKNQTMTETFFVSRKQRILPHQMFLSRANRETFRETWFLNSVSATMFPRLRGP